VASTRDRLVTATNELFRRSGFHGTSLKQVVEAADATIGSLYHFFPGGKDDLAEAAIRESGAAYRELFEVIADAAADAPTAITDFFDGAAEVLEQGDFIDICPIGTVAREVASSHDHLRRATDDVFRSWVEAAATRFAAAGLPEPEAESLATTAVATLEGSYMLARAHRDAAVVRTAGRHVRRLLEASLSAAAAAAATTTATPGARRARRPVPERRARR
jgi:AcrR family transcriptional regulator